MNQRRILVLSILFCVLALTVCSYTLSQILTQKTILASGSIVESLGIELYHDPICAFCCRQILWGDCYPSSIKRFDLYVKNIEVSACKIGFRVGEWIPSDAEKYIFLTWNYDNTPILPSRVTKVILNLKVSSDIWNIDKFQMKITIFAK